MTGAALGDRFGRRRLFAAGLALFALASAACALAPDVGWLIAARAVQGAGAALVMPLALALLSAAFPPERRGAAIGHVQRDHRARRRAAGRWSAARSSRASTGSGSSGSTCRSGSIAAPLVLRRIAREPRAGDRARPARPGARQPARRSASSGAWCAATRAGWGSAEVRRLAGRRASLLASPSSPGSCVRREPMLPMRLFRARAFSAGNAAIFFTFASLFSCVFLFAQFLQTALGYGPLDAGLRLIPWTVTLHPRRPGRRRARRPDRRAPADRSAGSLLQAVGLAWIALVADPASPTRSSSPPLVVAGVGVSMAIPAAQNAVVGAVARRRARQGGGREQHDARARRRVRHRGRRRRLRRGRAATRRPATFARRLRRRRRRRRRALARRRARRAGAAPAPDGAAAGSAPSPCPRGGADRAPDGVRYRVKPQFVDVNVELVRGRVRGAPRGRPPGFRYATFQLDDEVSFVHVAVAESDPPVAGPRGVPALPAGDRRALRGAAGGQRGPRGRVVSARMRPSPAFRAR